MAKKIPCTVICNASLTGYIFKPVKCDSIRAGLRYAKDMGMPYRLYVNGKLARRGWFVD